MPNLADGTGNPYDRRAPKRGRPQMLTPELKDKAIRLIEGGCFPSMLAPMLGVTRKTFYEWIKRGVNHTQWLEDNPLPQNAPKAQKAEHRKKCENDDLYAEFSNAVALAFETQKLAYLNTIQKAGTTGIPSMVTKETYETSPVGHDSEGNVIRSKPQLLNREVKKSLDIDWRAAAFLLERADPDQWQPRVKLDLARVPIDVSELERMSIEELEALAANLEAVLSPDKGAVNES